MAWDLEIERDLLADSCYKHFWPFALYAFGIGLNPEGRRIEPKVHKALCDKVEEIALAWLENRVSDDPIRFHLLIIASRDTYKTVFITKALTTWLHLRCPDLASIVDSVTITKAEEFMEVIKKFYEGGDPFSLFPWLYGKWEGLDPWTKSRFTHRARVLNISEASVKASSVETGFTGEHPDHLVVDDPITIEKLNEGGGWIEKANKHVASFHPALKNNSFYIICATPYQDGDVVTSAMRLDGIKESFGMPLPDEYGMYIKKDGLWYVYFMPAATEEDEPLLSKCWSKTELMRYKKKDPANYVAQVLLRPGTGENIPLTAEQIKDRLVEKRFVPTNLVYTIHSDTAFKDQEKIGRGDETVIEVWGHHPSNGDVYYIEGYGSNTWRSEDYTDKLISIVKRYRAEGKRVKRMTDEKQIGGKAGIWAKHLHSCFANADMYPPPFLEIPRPGAGKKVHRITEAAGYWVDGHVYIVKDSPGSEKLMWQMSGIGISKHDDWADAAADVFHPEIYHPYSVQEKDPNPPYPVRPGDEYLKTGVLSNAAAHDFYDSQFNQDKEWIRQPL